MSKFTDYVFVLWGEQFDETTATVFVSELRRAGLRVKVVGLVSGRMSGHFGLALVPDIMLDRALSLAAKAMCVVIPDSSPGLKRLRNEPRLREFLQQTRAAEAIFIVGQFDEADLAELGLSPSQAGRVLVYPEAEDLVEFAREVARSLPAAH
ncbi:MAG: DJ-1/PfpI family protein [Anaerolineae bacterium]